MWETNDEKTKLARVAVDFDSVLDDAFKINISKQIVQLPQQLQVEIKKLADVARKDSQRKYRKEAKQPPPIPPTDPPAPGGSGGTPAGGGIGPTTPSTWGGETTPPISTPTPPALPPQRVAVKEVKTDKFVWKMNKGMTGALDLQVSDVNPDLAALVRQIREDPQAVAYLVAFLGDLDKAGVQKTLLMEKVD